MQNLFDSLQKWFDVFYYEEIVHLKMYRVALGKQQQTKNNLVNKVAPLQMQVTKTKTKKFPINSEVCKYL